MCREDGVSETIQDQQVSYWIGYNLIWLNFMLGIKEYVSYQIYIKMLPELKMMAISSLNNDILR